MTRRSEVTWAFIAAGAIFCSQSFLVQALFYASIQVPFLTATRVTMVLAQTTIAGWFLKVFWDRGVEMILDEVAPARQVGWDDPVV